MRRCACALLLVAACSKQAVQAPLRKIEGLAEPTIQATVVTIQTSLQPQNKALTHSIVIANGLARSDDELDHWRLFNLDQNSITFVDDLAKTYYTVPVDVGPRPSAAAEGGGPTWVQTGAKRPSAAAEGGGPTWVQTGAKRPSAAAEGGGPTWVQTGAKRPSAAAEGGGPTWVQTGAKRVVNGVEASQFLIRMGAYQRELWIGAPPSIPQQLFAMMNADLSTIRGFPMLDHSELPYGKSKLIVDRSVVKIEQKNVPQSLLTLRSDYKNITAPAVSHPPASSPRPGQNTRAAG